MLEVLSKMFKVSGPEIRTVNYSQLDKINGIRTRDAYYSRAHRLCETYLVQPQLRLNRTQLAYLENRITRTLITKNGQAQINGNSVALGLIDRRIEEIRKNMIEVKPGEGDRLRHPEVLDEVVTTVESILMNDIDDADKRKLLAAYSQEQRDILRKRLYEF